MEVVHERSCGLDVHKRTVVACVITPEGKRTRRFKTMTKDVLSLADWLGEVGVTHVAMESTGVYWQPLYNLLEDDFEVWVVNAAHIKTVPGRKTDMKDAEWIADLLRHGLLRPSFVPDRPQRELRELTRHRRQLIRQRAQVVNRIQKVLEGGNIKLSSVATDVVGASGRAMLRAMIAGEDDPETLASMAKGRLREKRLLLVDALEGSMGSHQRMMLDSYLRHLDFLEREIERMSEEVEERTRPFEEVIERIDEIPGMGRRGAEQVVAEIGTDMNRFPTSQHLASWAGMCPGNNESAGKRIGGRTRRANPWLKSTLVEAAWASVKTRDTYLSAQYRRIAARRGKKRAIIAVAHSILVIIYHMLRDGTRHRDLGGQYFEERNHQAIVRYTVRRLNRLGYDVTLAAA